MDKQSLIKAREIIINSLHNSDIKAVDRLELIINIATLLEIENYEENIKILRLENKPKRK